MRSCISAVESGNKRGWTKGVAQWAWNKEVAGSTSTKKAGKGDGYLHLTSAAACSQAWPQKRAPKPDRSANSNASNRERYAMNKNKLTDSLTNKPESLPQPPANASGSPVSTSTKGSGEKNELATSNAEIGQVLTPEQEAIELFEKLHKQKNPSVADMVRLQKLIVSTPDTWWLAKLAMPPGWSSLIEKTSSGVVNALVRADMDILKKQMDYDTSSALEQMHIDHLLTAQLHLQQCGTKLQ